MDTVTVSPKYQIVIPKKLRERLGIRPGQKLLIFERDGAVRLVTPRPLRELVGMAKGLRWKEEDRDHTERF